MLEAQLCNTSGSTFFATSVSGVAMHRGTRQHQHVALSSRFGHAYSIISDVELACSTVSSTQRIIPIRHSRMHSSEFSLMLLRIHASHGLRPASTRGPRHDSLRYRPNCPIVRSAIPVTGSHASLWIGSAVFGAETQRHAKLNLSYTWLNLWLEAPRTDSPTECLWRTEESGQPNPSVLSTATTLWLVTVSDGRSRLGGIDAS